MTTLSDETLMAFADDELDAATRAQVTAAMREDPEIGKRIARHRALRTKLRLAYSADLDQAPPQRLLAAARGAKPTQRATGASGTVSDIGRARAAKPAHPTIAARRSTLWSAMAASLMLGIGLGVLALHDSNLIVTRHGQLVARGALADALFHQLGDNSRASTAVHLSLSFKSKSGDYCRTFEFEGTTMPAGIACRHAEDWRIEVLAPRTGTIDQPDTDTHARTASSSLSPVILAAVQGQIDGEALDHAGEETARRQGWQAPSR